jgi:hypothetical protein
MAKMFRVCNAEPTTFIFKRGSSVPHHPIRGREGYTHLVLGDEFLSLLCGDDKIGKSWYSHSILVVPSDGVASVLRTAPLWNKGVVYPTFRDGENLIVF